MFNEIIRPQIQNGSKQLSKTTQDSDWSIIFRFLGSSLLLIISLIMPSSHTSGNISVSSTKLTIRSVVFALFFMYSLLILSFAEALLFFSEFKHLCISDSVIKEFRNSLSSLISMFITGSSGVSLAVLSSSKKL